MTPYTKKIVELHKIHKAIEEKDCCNGGGNTPSGDITIDDVVKFIHDATEIYHGSFPYTTWDEIPEYEDANGGDICKTDNPANISGFSNFILNAPSYLIGKKRSGTNI